MNNKNTTNKEPWEMSREQFYKNVQIEFLGENEFCVYRLDGSMLRFDYHADSGLSISDYARLRVVRSAVTYGFRVPRKILLELGLE